MGNERVGDLGLTRRWWHTRGIGLALGASLLFLFSHVFFLSPTPASIDGVNFLLGVREFDVSDHRPHPPGYPLFIALGKVSHALMPSRATGRLDQMRAETRALAIWSALFGSIAVLPLLAIFRRLGHSDRRAWAAMLLTLVSPLFWMLAIRPLSDLAGLTVALMTQALLLMILCDRSAAGLPDRERRRSRTVMLASLLAGLAIGLRSQTLWLTVPLLLYTGRQLVRERRARIGLMAGAFAVGVLAWSVPLLIASGGVGNFLQAFQAQAGEDWRDGAMLAASFTPTHLTRAVVATFAFPFGNNLVAIIALTFGVIGLIVKSCRGHEGLKLIAVLYGPYLLFHLAFQDPSHTRYALPLIPAVAYLSVRGIDAAMGRFMPWAVAMLVAVSLFIVLPPVVVFARTGNPVFRALVEMEARVDRMGSSTPRPVMAMHHAVSRMLRGEQLPGPTLPSRPTKEWRELVRYWREGGAAPVWFLAERGRTDLALIDPASRRIVQSYAWPFDNRALMSSVKPRGVVWYELVRPSWMADEGWALTPETGGVAFADGRGPSAQPIQAFVRRRPEAVTLLIGGRRLNSAGAQPARIEARLDGRLVDSWIEGEKAFLRTWTIPAGQVGGSGPYATLEIVATATTPGGQRPTVVIDQFDVQSEGTLVYGFDSGWYELEHDLNTSRSWRWTDRIAVVRVRPPNADLVFRLTAERPLNYLPGPPQIVVRVGDEIVARVLADGDKDLDLTFRVSRSSLDRAQGLVILQTDRPSARNFKPPDPNRPFPGLRVFDLTLEPAR